MLSLLGVFCANRGVPRPFAIGVTGVAGRLTALGALGVVLTVRRRWRSAARPGRHAASPCARCWPSAAIIAWRADPVARRRVRRRGDPAPAGAPRTLLATLPGVNAALVVVLYWAGLCAGRVCAPLALRRSSKLVTLGVAAGLAALAVAGIASASTWSALAVSVFAAGFAVGRWRRRSSLSPAIAIPAGGLVIGVLISVAQLGAVLLPWIAGRVAISSGFRARAMLIPLARPSRSRCRPARYASGARSQTVEPTRSGAGMILFDLDGTLVDTTDLILQSFRSYVRHPRASAARRRVRRSSRRSDAPCRPARSASMAREEGGRGSRRLGRPDASRHLQVFQRERHDSPDPPVRRRR